MQQSSDILLNALLTLPVHGQIWKGSFVIRDFLEKAEKLHSVAKALPISLRFFARGSIRRQRVVKAGDQVSTEAQLQL
jgi:hypothetical protein